MYAFASHFFLQPVILSNVKDLFSVSGSMLTASSAKRVLITDY